MASEARFLSAVLTFVFMPKHFQMLGGNVLQQHEEYSFIAFVLHNGRNEHGHLIHGIRTFFIHPTASRSTPKKNMNKTPSRYLTKCTEAPLTTASTLTNTTSRDKGDDVDDCDGRWSPLPDKDKVSRSVTSPPTTPSGENCPDQQQVTTPPALSPSPTLDDDDDMMRTFKHRRPAVEPNQPPVPVSGQWNVS